MTGSRPRRSTDLGPRTPRKLSSFVERLKSSIQQCEWPIEQVMELLGQKGGASGTKAEEVPFDPEADIDEPSMLTNRQEWKPFQFNNQNKPRWIAYRGPPEAEPTVPLVLLHKSFEDFCGRANARSSLGLDDGDYDLASYIWDNFSSGYDDEKSQMTLPLNRKFMTYLGQTILLSPSLGYITTDGMVMYLNSDGKLLFEDKLEGADGFFQVLEYERKAFRENIVNGMPRLSHGMVVLRNCPYIQFVAVVMDWESRDGDGIKGTIMGEPLTHQINCFGPKETGIDSLCKALKAFKCFSQEYAPEPFIDVLRPYHLHHWTNLQRIGKQRLVFSGNNGSSNKVAKFTSVYSYDAHAAWAEAGVACKVDNVKALSSGWKFVVMELLSEADGWVCAATVVKRYKRNAAILGKLQAAMMEAVSKGHAAGFVHGDVRCENMFVKELEASPWFEVKLIDFDWAGLAGATVYPHRLNPKIKWHADAGYGKLIKPEHDFTFVSKLVSND